MPVSDITELCAHELLRAYRTRALSPVEATTAALERIEELNPVLNAFCLVDAESALEAARASERRWWKSQPCGTLDGVPTAIKDLLLTRGWPTLRGSLTTDTTQTWSDDAPATARLREHGAVLLGKTTTPEFGWKGVTDSPLTGITRNPWDPTLTPGGSSGGSAAALASGMCTLSVGTDGGGSIRIPCGFTGTYGIKANFGRVPAAPLSPFGTLSHVGPMTRSVVDAALMLNVISQPDSRDWHALPPERRDYRIGLEDGIRGLRIAYSTTLGYATVDAEVAGVVDRAVAVFSDLGAHVDQVDPGFDNPREMFERLWFAGAANLVRGIAPERHPTLEPAFAEVAAIGAAQSLLDYLEAVNERGRIGQRMNAFHQRFDLLLTPALPIAAFPVRGPDPASPHWSDWTPFTYPFNMTQQPAASVPCGVTSAGLPVGLQIVGARYAEALVLRASRAFEAACPTVRPDLSRLRADRSTQL